MSDPPETHGLSLRPETDSDEEFLRVVYASTRAPEMALVPWTDAQKDAFLHSQFDAQRFHYRQHFPNAAYDVILRDGVPIGRYYLDKTPDAWLLIDVALLPEHRNSGLGTALMRALLNAAAGVGKTVQLHVETFNPARHLYDRLGFTHVADQGIYILMSWTPPNA